MAKMITDECIGCTACVGTCPVNCITESKSPAFSIDEKACIDCDACVPACPVNAIVDKK